MIQLSLTIIDFGLLVLVWLVQFIIYPSFQYMEGNKLAIWHDKYQRLISYFVMPLMLSQLALTSYLLVSAPELYHVLHFTLIIMIWLSTFFQAVPVHQKIARQEAINENVPKLVKVNLLRSILWTVAFTISLILFIQNIQWSAA